MFHRTFAYGVLVVAALFLPAGRCLGAQPPADVEFLPDITYATVAGEELKLNLARPKDTKKGALPCVVLIHGGAWRGGHRNSFNDLAWRFAQRGYVAATVSYRFCPKFPFPAQVQDVKAAVRFLRSKEDYSIDPKRFGAVGASAGAHLAMMLGVMEKTDGLDDSGGNLDQPSKVQAVVSFFGPTDFLAEYPPASRNLVKDFLGGTMDEKKEAYKKASPITYVSKGDAPMLLLQGTKDPLVPWQQAIEMLEAMTKAGVPGRVEMMAGASHGWAGKELDRTLDETFEFLDDHLKKPGR